MRAPVKRRQHVMRVGELSGRIRGGRSMRILVNGERVWLWRKVSVTIAIFNHKSYYHNQQTLHKKKKKKNDIFWHGQGNTSFTKKPTLAAGEPQSSPAGFLKGKKKKKVFHPAAYKSFMIAREQLELGEHAAVFCANSYAGANHIDVVQSGASHRERWGTDWLRWEEMTFEREGNSTQRKGERETDRLTEWLTHANRKTEEKMKAGKGGRGESTERGRREREKDGLHKAERFRIGKLDNAIQRSLRKRLFHQHESRMNARNTYHAALDSTERARTN